MEPYAQEAMTWMPAEWGEQDSDRVPLWTAAAGNDAVDRSDAGPGPRGTEAKLAAPHQRTRQPNPT